MIFEAKWHFCLYGLKRVQKRVAFQVHIIISKLQLLESIELSMLLAASPST